eukprot:6176027-Pleurochrysis_carterae.AAC.1
MCGAGHTRKREIRESKEKRTLSQPRSKAQRQQTREAPSIAESVHIPARSHQCSAQHAVAPWESRRDQSGSLLAIRSAFHTWEPAGYIPESKNSTSRSAFEQGVRREA